MTKQKKEELTRAQDFANTLKDNPQEIIDWAYSEIEEYEKRIKILEKRLKS